MWLGRVGIRSGGFGAEIFFYFFFFGDATFAGSGKRSLPWDWCLPQEPALKGEWTEAEAGGN